MRVLLGILGGLFLLLGVVLALSVFLGVNYSEDTPIDVSSNCVNSPSSDGTTTQSCEYRGADDDNTAIELVVCGAGLTIAGAVLLTGAGLVGARDRRQAAIQQRPPYPHG